MTFVEQIKGIGAKLGIEVTGSNVADVLRSLEAGVDAKVSKDTPIVAPKNEAASQPVRKSKREKVEKPDTAEE